ncbi:hypothetical protein [Streptomyces sp. Je 1-332]|uniref:hypothetical protein n=1 Tax=Streptomyces sp. Je 1-332 TaxID=3231270 RepID=UPI00345953A4
MRVSRMRGSKTAAFGVAGLLAATVLTGCGSEGSGDDTGSGSGKKTEGAKGGGEKSPSQVLQATNEKTADAGSARLKISTMVSTNGKSETVTGSGVMDFGGGTSKLTMGQQGKKVEQRVVDKVLYQKPPKGKAQLPDGKPWLKIDLERLQASGVAGTDQASDPSDSFAYSKSLSDKGVKRVGEEEIGGVRTTHYRVSLDIDKLAQGDQKEADKMREQLGDSVPVNMWVDDKGLTRRMQLEMSAKNGKGSGGKDKVKVVMDFSDFGTNVDVDVPPSSDTADVTDKVIKESQGRQKA